MLLVLREMLWLLYVVLFAPHTPFAYDILTAVGSLVDSLADLSLFLVCTLGRYIFAFTLM